VSMDFAFTPEQELMRDSARRLVERDIAPVLKRLDRDKAVPKKVLLDIFSKLATLGMTSARVPESGGGSGLTMLDYGIMFEQIPPSISMSLVSHEGCIARLFAECSPEQRDRFLPDLIAGRKLACTGSTEPGTGSDPRGVTTRVTREGNTLVLNGRKMWITNVSACDVILVTCVDATRSDPRNRVVKVVVERDKSPFEAREIDTIGLKQGLLGEAVFDNCRVSADNLLESSKDGTRILKETWNVARPMVGLMAVHLAQAAFEVALDYAKMRKQFGKPIAAHQLVQKNLSDIATAIITSRLLCYRALSVIDRGERAEGASAMAKRYAQMACREAVWQAMNILGAMGLSREAGLEEYYRDIRMLPIPDGTNEILALIHGRELTNLEAFRGVMQAS
jgi:alkylation response protein AidB-like acyl-CoA dehydrogenase